jgi:hypothetical protein
LGSTGRNVPNNLKEQAAMLVTRADPANGKTIISELGDSRWPSASGWVKKSALYRNESGNIDIHYVFNTITDQVDDFKFK